MNTVVFVLVVWTHAGNFVPTIEFTTLAKCEAAATSFVTEGDKRLTVGKPGRPWCWRVEK